MSHVMVLTLAVILKVALTLAFIANQTDITRSSSAPSNEGSSDSVAGGQKPKGHEQQRDHATGEVAVRRPPPLVIRGGDPALRAFMRTLTVVESNSARPYHLVYGGSHVDGLSRHPNRCIPIRAAALNGQCSTAAGRYQMLHHTWQMVASKYHPDRNERALNQGFRFEPVYQDGVVYRWLEETSYWGCDVSRWLESQGLMGAIQRCPRLKRVWPSLPGGDQENSFTRKTPEIFEILLAEEKSGNTG